MKWGTRPLSHTPRLKQRSLVEGEWVIIVTVCPSQTQCQGYQQARGNRKQVCVQALWPKKKINGCEDTFVEFEDLYKTLRSLHDLTAVWNSHCVLHLVVDPRLATEYNLVARSCYINSCSCLLLIT